MHFKELNFQSRTTSKIFKEFIMINNQYKTIFLVERRNWLPRQKQKAVDSK